MLLDQIVRQTPLPATFGKKVAGTLLAACLGPAQEPWRAPASGLPGYRQWQEWHWRVVGSAQEAAFSLGFRLLDPPADADDQSALEFVAIPRDDPSQRLALADYWSLSGEEQRPLRRQLGDDFETELLLNLGLAARMVPKLWDGLDTAQPQAVTLNLDEAFAFLKEWAWVLEDAGFKIIVPAWWTPQGRRRVRLRLRSSSSTKAHGATPAAGGLSLEHLVQYRYELAIGDQLVSPEEWQQLVEAKTPLVRFRGQWVELDPGRMQEMLAFWHQHGKEAPEMNPHELLQRTATDDTLEVEPGDALAEMLERLRDRSRREAMIAASQDPQGEPAVFVLSLKAGGVGITLTKANHVFHFDRWWNPAVEDQASDRAFRIGQEKTVFVHRLVTLGTLEERINDMIEEKRRWPGPSSGPTSPGSPSSTTSASRP